MNTNYRQVSLLALLITSLLANTHQLVGEEAAGHSPLADTMEEMQDAYRIAGRAIRRPAENLEKLLDAAQVMQRGAVASKVMSVEVPEGIENAEEYQRMFRIGMVKTLIALAEFEEALLVEDFDMAKKAFEELKAVKARGHEQFKID